MKQRKGIAVFLASMIFILAALPVAHVEAASATISISMVSEHAPVESVCSFAVLVSANTTLSSVKMTIAYDEDYLEPISDNRLYELGDSSVIIYDTALDSKSVRERKYILQFKTLKKGNTKLSIEGTPEIYESSSNTALSSSKKEFPLTIYEKDKKSDNNKLSLLSAKEGTFTTKFDPDKTVYELNVDYEKTKITLQAEPQDENASVAIVGNDELQVGANKVGVIVTSDSGKEKEYTIYVNRSPLEDGGQEIPEASEEPGVPTESIQPSMSPEPMEDNHFVIKKENALTYFEGKTKYLILEPFDDSNVPAGYKRVTINQSGTEVTAYAIDGNSYQDFVLFYAKQEGQDPGWYQFDQVEGTLQRFNEMNLTGEEKEHISVTDDEVRIYQDRIDLLGLILGIAACLIMLLLIVVIHMYMKHKGYSDELE